jgi:hypothetical protein
MDEATLAWKKYLRNVAFGTIVGVDGWYYNITWEDAMWACRAVMGESGVCPGGCQKDGEAVVWAMVNRAFKLRNRTMRRGPPGSGLAPLQAPHTLAEVFLWYCQPINPYWRDRGENADRRRHIAAMGPGDPWLNERTIDTVLRVLMGLTDGRPYQGIVDFADCDCVDCGRDTHGTEDFKIGNCFWSDAESDSWGPDTVRIVNGIAPLRRASLPLALSLLISGSSALIVWLGGSRS